MKISGGLNFIRRAAADHQRGVALLLDGAARRAETMNAKQQALLAKLTAEITNGMDALKPLRDRQLLQIVGGKDAS